MIRALVWTSLATVLSGCCGYLTDPERGYGREERVDLPRIHVAPFDTKSFRRGLEMNLTRQVADEIRARSPHSPASRRDADWTVSGTITRASERVLSGDTDDSVRESSFWVTAEIVVRDARTDRIIGSTEFTKYQPFTERTQGRFKTDQDAAKEVLREIAEATVYWLEAVRPSVKK